MGNYDQSEYERREQTPTETQSSPDDQPDEYHGTVTFEEVESTATLLEELKEIKEG
ncbi:hypothetical protein C500_00282 [Natrialba magadii ATCC 43099]|nr:hypothetical protein C500_00282 [Natrialba magadii ATCC 43099]